MTNDVGKIMPNCSHLYCISAIHGYKLSKKWNSMAISGHLCHITGIAIGSYLSGHRCGGKKQRTKANPKNKKKKNGYIM